MRYRWVLLPGPADHDKAVHLCRSGDLPVPGLTPVQALLLLGKGMESPDQIKKFMLRPRMYRPEDFQDPYLIPDMEQGVQRIWKAAERHEPVLIFGDYDADGITSIALLYRFFSKYFSSMPLSTYQPSRFNEGYGFNLEGVDFAVKKKVGLIITVDCGITGHETVEYARVKGIDVIITDHHEVSNELPQALAVIDPKRKDAMGPFRDWAGVGVAFNLVLALIRSKPEYFSEVKLAPFLELAAIGTIADIVPLLGENRTIVKAGFSVLNREIRTKKGVNPGLFRLREKVFLLEKRITVRQVAFGIAPRLNAAGRIEEASLATELLISEDADRIDFLVDRINDLNEQRKKLQKEIVRSISKELEEDLKNKDTKVIVFAGENIAEGVRGVVASKLVQSYNRPALVFSVDQKEGIAAGSGRSLESLDLFALLKQCEDLFLSWGGHKQAAGITMKMEHMEEFRKRMTDLIDKTVTEEDLQPVLKIDAPVLSQEIVPELFRFLEYMQPFGEGNPCPCFLLKKVRIRKIDQNVRFDPYVKKERSFYKIHVISEDEAFHHTLTLWEPEYHEELENAEGLWADFVLSLSVSESKGTVYNNLTVLDLQLTDH